jgi:hypothetical protein
MTARRSSANGRIRARRLLAGGRRSLNLRFASRAYRASLSPAVRIARCCEPPGGSQVKCASGGRLPGGDRSAGRWRLAPAEAYCISSLTVPLADSLRHPCAECAIREVHRTALHMRVPVPTCWVRRIRGCNTVPIPGPWESLSIWISLSVEQRAERGGSLARSSAPGLPFLHRGVPAARCT